MFFWAEINSKYNNENNLEILFKICDNNNVAEFEELYDEYNIDVESKFIDKLNKHYYYIFKIFQKTGGLLLNDYPSLDIYDYFGKKFSTIIYKYMLESLGLNNEDE